MNKAALLSPCALYRYMLLRSWDRHLPFLYVCMLNPSTADATEDDATVRWLIGWAKLRGYGGVVIVNLFALRSKDPVVLSHSRDAIGPDNDRSLIEYGEASIPHGGILCAWGQPGSRFVQQRAADVTDVLVAFDVPLWRFDVRPYPKHPLYTPHTTKLVAIDAPFP